MITVGFIKAGDRARVDYYLARATSDVEERTRLESGPALAAYYGGATANGPGRWLGRGADSLGLTDRVAEPEAFTRAVLEGYLDGEVRAKPVLRTHPEGLVAAEPFAAAVRQLAQDRGVEAAELFTSGRAGREWAALSRVADRFATVPASTVAKLGRGVGIDPAGLYGPDSWARSLERAGQQVDQRLAALDVVMAAPKSVSVLYAAGDDATRRQIATDLHEAVRETLTYLDSLAATGVRGSRSEGTDRVEETDGLVAVAFMHDEARPTGDCQCGDPHLHEHTIVVNAARGRDRKWSAVQHDRVAPNARTAGFLFQAELRERLSRSLGVQWRPIVNGIGEVAGISDEALRTFSKRHDEIAAELAEAGEEGTAAAHVAQKATRNAKRAQLALAERVELWQAEAGEVGLLTADVAGRVLDRPADGPHLDRDGPEYGSRVLAGLTAEASSFSRSDVLRALAADCRQGAGRAELEARADRILGDPAVAVALAEGEGGLTSSDVRRSSGGRVYAYQVGQRWTTPEQLTLEARLVDAAAGRVGTGCARLDGDLVEAVIARQPFVLSTEQAAAVRGLTTSGHGVEVLHAGAGSGKTSAVLGTVRQAYETAGYRVIGAATSAKAARVLADDGGLDAQTVARLLLDLQRPDHGGLGPRTVLVLDEASMVGSRDLAPLLEHAQAAGAKVLVVGDTRQLASVDAGGGLRGLRDRLGAHELAGNRRQHAEWERTALAALATGQPGEALRAYQAHERVTVADSALGARRAMVGTWWRDVAERGIDRTLMVAVRNVDRVELNRLARDVLAEAGQLGDVTVRAAGRDFAAGDRVMLLRNSSARRYDNGDTGTVSELLDGRRLVVRLDRGTVETLTASYLDAGNLDHAYATTVHKAQGSTVATAHVLGTALAREDGYVALSRGRADNRLYLVQGEPEAEIDLPQREQRSAYEAAARSLSVSRAKALALDSSVWGADAAELARRLADTARLLRSAPASDAARVPALRAEAVRLDAQVADARERLDGLRKVAGAPSSSSFRKGLRGASGPDREAQVRLDRQAGVLAQLEARTAEVQHLVASVDAGTTPRERWADGHSEQLAGAVAAGRELAWRGRAEQRAAGAVAPAAGLDAPGRDRGTPEAPEAFRNGQARTLTLTTTPGPRQ